MSPATAQQEVAPPTPVEEELQSATSPPAPDPAGGVVETGRAGGPAVKTIDFSQPTKFTAELRRRIERVLGLFCEAFAQRLSTELRTSVELTLGDSSQLTWAAAKARLSASTIAVALTVQPVERQLLLCVEPPFVLQTIECLLGGDASQPPEERHLTEVDWALTGRLLQLLLAHLSPAWRDLGSLELQLGAVDVEGDADVLVPVGEPTLALTLATRIDGLPSSMTLLIPWSALEPVAGEILGGGPTPQDVDSREARAVRRGLAGAHVRLRAEVGALEMPVERMLALAPGTLLALGDRAEEGVQLFAEGVPLGRARPGLRGSHRAVKITALAERSGAPQTNGSHRLRPEAAVGASPDGHAAPGDQAQAAPAREGLGRMLGVPVRVWAELGHTTLPLGQTLELPLGSVVELDQAADDPIDLFVNGLPFAHGTLQVSADGAWAVRIDALI
jgi:flagellar motor switch protein FliM